MEGYRPITQWHEDDKPREKLMNKGRSALSDAELIAVLLGLIGLIFSSFSITWK